MHERDVNRSCPVATLLPILTNDGVEHLVQVFVATDERFSQDAFRDGADLRQCAPAATVLDGAASLEPVYAHLLEDELEHQGRAEREDASAPELSADGEPPLGRIVDSTELVHVDIGGRGEPNLKQSDGGVAVSKRDDETRAFSRRAQTL